MKWSSQILIGFLLSVLEWKAIKCQAVTLNVSTTNYQCNRVDSNYGRLVSLNCPTLSDQNYEDSGKEILYILAMAPYPVQSPEIPRSWAGGAEVIPGALLAVSHINDHSTVLPNHTLKLVIRDSGCNNTSVGSLNFLNSIFYESQERNRNIVGIVGAGCSESSFRLGYLGLKDDISLLQISPSATSPSFVTDIKNYLNLFRPIASALNYIKVILEIVNKNNYTDVAILYEANRKYMTTIEVELSNSLMNESIKVESFGLGRTVLSDALSSAGEKYRFIVVLTATNFSQYILCLAYHKGMLHPDYQFIFVNRRPEEIIVEVEVNDFTKCNKSVMKMASSPATLLEFGVTRQDKNTTTVGGYTYYEAECQYCTIVQKHKRLFNIFNFVSTKFQNTYYDAIWALAMSLHNASLLGVNLTNYTYGQPNVTKIIREQLLKVTFEGLSGSIRFSEDTQDVSEITVTNIFQQANNSENFNLVGYYDIKNGLSTEKEVYFVSSSMFPTFTDIAHPSSALGYILITLACVVGMGVAVLHYINSVYRKSKNIKANSPNLNHLIFSGCYLFLLTSVFSSLETTIVVRFAGPNEVIHGVVCNAQVWAASLSFTMVFGTVCVKVWRILKLFSHFRSDKIKFAGDTNLVTVVLCIIAVDVIFLTAWNVVNPFMAVTTKYKHENVTFIRSVCSCDNLQYWLGALLFYKLILLACVLYLAFVTRHIKRPEFKQTKSINALIYVLVFINVLGIVPYTLVFTGAGESHLIIIYIVYVLLNFSFIMTAILCAAFLCLPPIYEMIKQKIG